MSSMLNRAHCFKNQLYVYLNLWLKLYNAFFIFIELIKIDNEYLKQYQNLNHYYNFQNQVLV
jgi:hypothetical protein